MKSVFRAAIVAAFFIVPISVQATEVKPVELSDSELSTLQSKNFDAPYSVLFPSVMATLQDSNYLNINASKDAGTATAETDAKSKLVYNIFWGIGKKKRTQLASIFMEPVGDNKSTLKLKLSIIETKNRGGFGGAYSDGTPVKIGEPYRDFYAKLDGEVARRMAAQNAPAPAPTPAPAAAETAPKPAA